jgi:predicted ATPase
VPQNVNLIGPHGCGKTELAIQFAAARHGRPLLIMDCANLREARDWFRLQVGPRGYGVLAGEPVRPRRRRLAIT